MFFKANKSREKIKSGLPSSESNGFQHPVQLYLIIMIVPSSTNIALRLFSLSSILEIRFPLELNPVLEPELALIAIEFGVGPAEREGMHALI